MKIFMKCSCFFIFVLSASYVRAYAGENISQEEIEMVIKHIVVDGIKEMKVKPYHKNIMLREEEKRKELSFAIFDASQQYRIDPLLLVVTAFREGGFDNNSVGSIGERTTFQLAPVTLGFIKNKNPSCDIKNYFGSAKCSAFLFNKYLDQCGESNLEGVIVKYVFGNDVACEIKTNKQKRVVGDRVDFVKNLHEFLKK
jgi:hypothetical protein